MSQRKDFIHRHRFALGFLGVFLLILVYMSSSRFIGGSDVYPGRFVPVSLVTEGDYDLNEFMFLRNNNPSEWMAGAKYYHAPGKVYHGKVISNSPTLAATLMAPFYIIPFRIMNLSPRHYLVFYMEKAFASLFVALSALFVFLALREKRTTRGWAILITVAYALGTSSWAISSQALWQHGPSQFFVAMSLWLWVRQKRTNSGFFLCGLAVGGAVASRMSNAVWSVLLFLDIFLLYRTGDIKRITQGFLSSFEPLKPRKMIRWIWLFLKSRKAIILFIAGGMPAFFFLFFYNLAHFGAPWKTAYNVIGGGVSASLKYEYMPAGILGLLFSPSLGLIPNAPFYIFIPLSIWLAFHHRFPNDKNSHIILPVLFITSNILLYSQRLGWWGGWSFVYRRLTDVLPALSFLLFGMSRLKFAFTRKWIAWPVRSGVMIIFIIFLAWGTFVQAFGVYMWFGNYYREWKNINQKLYVNFQNHAPDTIFDHESVHWTFDKKYHLIFREWKLSKWDPSRRLVTPGKIYHDLFVKKHIKYGKYAPIILQIGEGYKP